MSEHKLRDRHDDDAYESSDITLSSRSDDEGEEETSYIRYFCSLPGNEFFCEVEEDYIEDSFNLTGLAEQVHFYDIALDMLLDIESPKEGLLSDEELEVVNQSVDTLYGLIHARYILTNRGMETMCEKYQNVDFGRCYRVLCEGQPLLPVGQSDVLGESTVNMFCPSCCDLYFPRSSKQGHVDGAFFGTTFPHLFQLKFPDIIPRKSTGTYVPRIYGFRVHRDSEYWKRRR